ncbi:hypothetical protein [Novosphingobium sp.]|uniref:hypothetical protein n=1 Tax=Novosphingobium sp. TaxID=1874826 RepID=UPI0035653A23
MKINDVLGTGRKLFDGGEKMRNAGASTLGLEITIKKISDHAKVATSGIMIEGKVVQA